MTAKGPGKSERRKEGVGYIGLQGETYSSVRPSRQSNRNNRHKRKRSVCKNRYYIGTDQLCSLKNQSVFPLIIGFFPLSVSPSLADFPER